MSRNHRSMAGGLVITCWCAFIAGPQVAPGSNPAGRPSSRSAGRPPAASDWEPGGSPAGAQGLLPENSASERRASETDWPKIVPGDVGFYVELHDLTQIRQQFLALGIWGTVRQLSDPGRGQATSLPAQVQAAGVLGLNPESAITLLLGRRAAIIASTSARWRDGVVLAELQDAEDLPALLGRWQARQQADEGSVRRYLLSGDLRLAVLDRTIVLGPASDSEGLWTRTVQLLAGKTGSTLAGRSEFAGLRARLSRDYPGLLYVVWPEGDPTAIGGCDRLLVGASVTSAEITCELRGHRLQGAEDMPCLDAGAIGALPADSTVVWTSGFDFSTLTGSSSPGSIPEADPLLRYVLSVLTVRSAAADDLHPQLGPRYAVVLGLVRSAAQEGRVTPVVPEVTALVDVAEGEEYLKRLDRLGALLVRVYGLLGRPPGERLRQVQVEQVDFEGVRLHTIAIGPLLVGNTGRAFLEGINPCWALVDGRLVVSTSRKHVEKIIQAARRQIARLDDTGPLSELLPREAEGEAVNEWVSLRGGPLSLMFTSWLNYARHEKPEMLNRQWWQSWATDRVEEKGRLGVGLSDDPDGPRAIVRELRRNSPALGFLRLGDVIVGADGKPLPTSQPALEVARRYRDRGAAVQFEVELVRDGTQQTVQIPVPPALDFDLGGFDPVMAIRHFAMLAHPADTVTAWRYATGPARYDARILIRWSQVKLPRRPEKPQPGAARP